MLQLLFSECQLYTRYRSWCSSPATAERAGALHGWLVHQDDQEMGGRRSGKPAPGPAAPREPSPMLSSQGLPQEGGRDPFVLFAVSPRSSSLGWGRDS